MISHPLVVVTATVLLGLLSAILLKEAASLQGLSWLVMGLFFGAVMFVNGLRFVLWGVAHRRHPISLTYPLSSLFFPLIFFVSHFFYGEPVTLNKIIGVVLIVLGVAVITYFDNSESENL